MESNKLSFRSAGRDDVPRLVAMLADDALGAKRERFVDPLPNAYWQAFESIDSDPNNTLLVAEVTSQLQDLPAGSVVGFLQLTFIPYLTYQGRSRAMVEGVRVDKAARGLGVGAQLIREAIHRAQQRNCHLVQLTCDKQRPDAIRFYEQLGFQATHEGFKLHFP